MSPAPLLAFLGVTFLLPGVQTLNCQWGTTEIVRNVSQLPLTWTSSQTACEINEGCQETLLLIENGPQVSLVLTKGCTAQKDQEAKVTEHRAGPGLSITSYTRVCRHRDFCNDLSSTVPLWAPPSDTVPGSLRCPLCFSNDDCPQNGPQQICPAGYTHCYNGVVKFIGGGIASNLRVQGCMPQPGCNLLNGTQLIGSMDVTENCSPRSAIQTCNRGTMLRIAAGLSQKPVEWTTNQEENCNPGEVCQETLLLIDVGHKSLLVGSKGCSSPQRQDAPTVFIHSGSPGVLVASYAWFCSSILCNSAKSSSVLLNSLPRPAASAPGSLQCPVCVQFGGSCSQVSNFIICPNGTNHCYKGDIHTRGGGVSATLAVQGCMPESSKSLLKEAQKIGIFSVNEDFEGKTKDPLPPSSSAPAPYLALVAGLGLPVAFWCGGFLLPVKSIFP
uniref:CD177 antigen n=1 Tax=Heterocephalus glaber TaxID=10181 RepID=A0A0P6J6I0_HETGA